MKSFKYFKPKIASGIGLILLLGLISLFSLRVNNYSQSILLLTIILGLMGLPIFLMNPQLILFITVIVIPLGVLVVVVPGMTAVPLLGALLFVLCLPHFLIGKLKIPPLNKLYIYYLLLSIMMTISTLLGINRVDSLKYLKSIFQMMGFSFLLICLMNTRDKLKILWWIIFLSCTFASLITVLSKFGLLPFSLNALSYGNLGVERQTGTDGDPNYFAVQLSVGFAFGLSAMLYLKNKWKWVVVFPLLLILLGGIGLTLSLGAIIGLLFLLGFHGVTTNLLTKMKKVLFIIILIVISIGIYMTPSIHIRASQQIAEGEYGIWRMGSGRILTWMAGTNLIIHHPIWGVGIANHGSVLAQYDVFNRLNKQDLDLVKVAHNMYISFAADNGIPALIVFLCIIGFVFRRLWQINRLNLPDKFIINSVLSSLFCYLIQNIFLDGWRGKYLWVLIGMGAASIYLNRENKIIIESKNDLLL